MFTTMLANSTSGKRGKTPCAVQPTIALNSSQGFTTDSETITELIYWYAELGKGRVVGGENWKPSKSA